MGNEQSVFLTPNATTPYIFASLDLAKTGPVVMEMPVGAIAGSALDAWQRALSDLGMTGPDQGKGGKYVFVGPGQEAPTAEGAFVDEATWPRQRSGFSRRSQSSTSAGK
jgi:hypothetical protein